MLRTFLLFFRFFSCLPSATSACIILTQSSRQTHGWALLRWVFFKGYKSLHISAQHDKEIRETGEHCKARHQKTAQRCQFRCHFVLVSSWERRCSRKWLLPPVPYHSPVSTVTAECDGSRDWRDCWVTAGWFFIEATLSARHFARSQASLWIRTYPYVHASAAQKQKWNASCSPTQSSFNHNPAFSIHIFKVFFQREERY